MRGYKIVFNGVKSGADMPEVVKAFPECGETMYRDYTVTALKPGRRAVSVALPLAFGDSIEEYLKKHPII